MNGMRASLAEIAAIRDAVRQGGAGRAEVLICPPATLIAAAPAAARLGRRHRRRRIATPRRAARIPATSRPRCWRMPAPAHVIVGHSERRADHGESDDDGARQGGGRLAGRADADRLRRRDGGQREAGETLPVVAASSTARAAMARPAPTAGHRL